MSRAEFFMLLTLLDELCEKEDLETIRKVVKRTLQEVDSEKSEKKSSDERK